MPQLKAALQAFAHRADRLDLLLWDAEDFRVFPGCTISKKTVFFRTAKAEGFKQQEIADKWRGAKGGKH